MGDSDQYSDNSNEHTSVSSSHEHEDELQAKRQKEGSLQEEETLVDENGDELEGNRPGHVFGEYHDDVDIEEEESDESQNQDDGQALSPKDIAGKLHEISLKEKEV